MSRQRSKQEIARVQLEKAIELYCAGSEDPVCIVTLAGASEDITRRFLERKGESPSAERIKEWIINRFGDSSVDEQFYRMANYTRNALKHFSDRDEDMVHVDMEDARYWLLRALLNYDKAGFLLTKPIIEFMGSLSNGKA